MDLVSCEIIRPLHWSNGLKVFFVAYFAAVDCKITNKFSNENDWIEFEFWKSLNQISQKQMHVWKQSQSKKYHHYSNR